MLAFVLALRCTQHRNVRPQAGSWPW